MLLGDWRHCHCGPICGPPSVTAKLECRLSGNLIQVVFKFLVNVDAHRHSDVTRVKVKVHSHWHYFSSILVEAPGQLLPVWLVHRAVGTLTLQRGYPTLRVSWVSCSNGLLKGERGTTPTRTNVPVDVPP